MATPQINLNLPRKHRTNTPKHPSPATDFLTGTWHVTHSSLPLWRSKRNVNITYTPLPDKTTRTNTPQLDDLVQYQESTGKTKSVHGIDTPSRDSGAWDWRGRGWLVIASSHWECLGFGIHAPHANDNDGDGEGNGTEEGNGHSNGNGNPENQWMVTYFAKTLFTPAGIDIYSRRKEGLPTAFVEEILGVLRGFDVGEITELADSVFQIPQD